MIHWSLRGLVRQPSGRRPSKTRLWRLLPLVAVLLVLGSVGCGGSDSESEGAGFELLAEIRVADVSGSSGLGPGDPVPQATVELREGSMTLDDAPLQQVLSDAGGEARFLVSQSGRYQLFATAQTEDPLCTWIGSAEADIADAGARVELEVLLACN